LLVDDFFVGQWLSERLGQQFIVDNRPGAGGNIGTETVVRAPADGYTLLLACASSAIDATLFDKLNCGFIRNIAPIASILHDEGRAGFGTKLISRVLSYDLVGTAGFDFDREGFRCTLTFPVPPPGVGRNTTALGC
jgi:hypothetical protein